MIESELCRQCWRPYASLKVPYCDSCIKDGKGYDVESRYYWICTCGHYEEGGCHCSGCGGEAPWGCDCGLQEDLHGPDDPYNDFYF